MSKILKKQKLFLRTATIKDTDDIVALLQKVYDDPTISKKAISSRINIFPEGQFVAIYKDQIVGYAATFIIDEKTALTPHTYKEITGNYGATRHNINGDILYGMEVCVDADMRGVRIGQRLYNMRKKLCTDLALKGIVFGGRLPNYHKHAKKGVSVEDYIQNVISKKAKDPVLGFQVRNGYEVIGVLKNYNEYDEESKGYAAHLIWRNTLAESKNTSKKKQITLQDKAVRVASVQFEVRKVNSFEDFIKQIEFFVDTASDYKSDFIVFPELFTLALLTIDTKKRTQEEAIREMTDYTDDYVKAMSEMAMSYNINIIGGSHPTLVGEDLKNISYVFLRGGEVHQQAKIQPTPSERFWWNMKGDDNLNVIQTDCGPIGVLICYDSEFPELTRHLADQGALMLFVPFCTDERQGYLRVKYCCQARAVENQIYVTTSGVVGNLPDVDNMDIHYAASHIMTPCDFPFDRDGIAAMTSENTEQIIFADLNLKNLLLARDSGSVQNFKDRRFDLYEVKWHK